MLASFLAALAALAVAPASAAAQEQFGGASAIAPSLGLLGPSSRLVLRRPAYVVVIAFDGENAEVLYPQAGESPRLEAGSHRLETPEVVGLRPRERRSRSCNRPGEKLFIATAASSYPPPGATDARPANTSSSGNQNARGEELGDLEIGRAYCYRDASWSHAQGMGASTRHLLLIASEAPLGNVATKLSAVVSTLSLEQDEHEAVAASLARALAPADEKTWAARVYTVRMQQ